MARLYINGMYSISPQSSDLIEEGTLTEYDQNIVPAQSIDYKSIIKPMKLRRLSKAVKMGVYCGLHAMREAAISDLDAIIVGTGKGCQQDTEKFLQGMLSNNEEMLSPTSFIQSTHNTIAGQIALELKCTAYNMTYSHNSISMESVFLDALLQAEELSNYNFLVGGVDEISEKFTNFLRLNGELKREAVINTKLLESNTKGTAASELAAFFILSDELQPNSYARIEDVKVINQAGPSEIQEKLENFLNNNKLKPSNIDLVILGNNGDVQSDNYYLEVQRNLFKTIPQLGFKHLVGENNSATSYAVWLASKILKDQNVPDIFRINHIACRNPERVLIYNQDSGKNHGLILLSKV